MPTLRLATKSDLPAINAIYNHYVLHSTCTYQTVPSTSEERETWFDQHGGKYPITVAEKDGGIIGWGSLSKFHPRQAYENSVEDSVYVHQDWHGRGIGSLLLADLIERARALGHHTMLGGIDADQKGSMALHAKFGFVECAVFKQVGYKQDRWLDVIWMQKML